MTTTVQAVHDDDSLPGVADEDEVDDFVRGGFTYWYEVAEPERSRALKAEVARYGNAGVYWYDDSISLDTIVDVTDHNWFRNKSGGLGTTMPWVSMVYKNCDRIEAKYGNIVTATRAVSVRSMTDEQFMFDTVTGTSGVGDVLTDITKWALNDSFWSSAIRKSSKELNYCPVLFLLKHWTTLRKQAVPALLAQQKKTSKKWIIGKDEERSEARLVALANGTTPPSMWETQNT